MKRNGHPDPATLALHAGKDLGWFQAWKTERHVADCVDCREEIAAYQGMRDLLPRLSEMPDLPWNRLAGEMRANIRLGLAAGECVEGVEVPAPKAGAFAGLRPAFAVAGVLALLITGLILERPKPVNTAASPVVQVTGEGIERRNGDRGFALMHAGVEVKDVTYSVGAQGTMGARYVDPETNLVTVTKVYVE
jgi:hypothetical protein